MRRNKDKNWQNSGQNFDADKRPPNYCFEEIPGTNSSDTHAKIRRIFGQNKFRGTSGEQKAGKALRISGDKIGGESSAEIRRQNMDKFPQFSHSKIIYDWAALALRGTLAVLNFPAEAVRESMKEMTVRFGEGCSPVLELKKKHLLRRRSAMATKTVEENEVRKESESDADVLVFDNLGADYLEELLCLSSSP
ncbi:hypothetical protein QQ045_022477 [Rhodiola kirilowii]